MNNIFASNLKKLMYQKDVNAPELAKGVGLTPSSISQYLNNQMIPREKTALKIANYFNVPIAELMGEKEQETNISLLIKQLIENTSRDYLIWSVKQFYDGTTFYEGSYNNHIYRVEYEENPTKLLILTYKGDLVLEINTFTNKEKDALSHLFGLITINTLSDEDKTIINLIQELRETPEDLKAKELESNRKIWENIKNGDIPF